MLAEKQNFEFVQHTHLILKFFTNYTSTAAAARFYLLRVAKPTENRASRVVAHNGRDGALKPSESGSPNIDGRPRPAR